MLLSLHWKEEHPNCVDLEMLKSFAIKLNSEEIFTLVSKVDEGLIYDNGLC